MPSLGELPKGQNTACLTWLHDKNIWGNMKINSVKELPIWLNLENYKILNGMSLGQLSEQIRLRRQFILFSDKEVRDVLKLPQLENLKIFWEFELGNEDIFQLCLDIGNQFEGDFAFDNLSTRMTIGLIANDFVKIREGHPIIMGMRSNLLEIVKKIKPSYTTEPNSSIVEKSIRAFSIEDLKEFASALTNFYSGNLNEENENKEDGQSYKLGVATEKHSENFNSLPLEKTLFTIADIENNTDEELIRDFRSILHQFRKRNNVLVKDGITLSKQSHKEKILRYKVIPYLDIKIWQLYEGALIPDRVIAAFLYEGEKGEVELRQTVKKFINNVFEKDYRAL